MTGISKFEFTKKRKRREKKKERKEGGGECKIWPNIKCYYYQSFKKKVFLHGL